MVSHQHCLLYQSFIAFIPEKETKENTLTRINRIFYGSNKLIEETLREGKDNVKKTFLIPQDTKFSFCI